MKSIKLRLMARNFLVVMCEGICITLALVLPQGSAHAEVWSWGQPPGATSTISIPMRGALTLLDRKRAPNEVQWVVFQVDLGQYFATFPNEHLFVIMDGEYEIKEGRTPPYGGRGIALWINRICIEEFSNQATSACTPLNVPWSSWPPIKYEITIHVSETYVSYWMNDAAGNIVANNAGYLPDLRRGPDAPNISLIGIGAIGDNVSYSAPIFISNIRHGRF